LTSESRSAIFQSFMTSHMPCIHSGRHKITFCLIQHAPKLLVKHSDAYGM